MAIQAIAEIRFITHKVQVAKDDESDRIYCFKYDDQRCSLETFDDHDQASDWILQPFPSMEFEVKLNDEE